MFAKTVEKSTEIEQSEESKQKVKKWILVADDEQFFRDLLRSHLELNYGKFVQIIEASDGIEACHRLPFQAFDCIITDLCMPKKEGSAFIQSVKESQLNSQTPIIVISGFNTYQTKDPHIQLMSKPLQANTFIDAVDKQLKLGKTNQRVAADILNSVIGANLKFCNKLHNKASGSFEENEPSIRQLESQPKAKDQSLHEYEHISHFSIKIGDTKNSFAIGYSKKFLNFLRKNFRSAKENWMQAEGAGEVVIKFALNNLGIPNASISERSVLDVEKGDANFINFQKGILTPINTPYGSISVMALWK